MNIKTNDFIVSAINQAVNQSVKTYDWTLPTTLSFPKNGDRKEYEANCLNWGQERYDAIVSDVILRLSGEFNVSDENIISDINAIVDEAIQNEIFNNMTDMFCIEKVTVIKEKCFVIAKSPQEALECFERCSTSDDPSLQPVFYEDKATMPPMVRPLNNSEIAMSCEVLDGYNKAQESE